MTQGETKTIQLPALRPGRALVPIQNDEVRGRAGAGRSRRFSPFLAQVLIGREPALRQRIGSAHIARRATAEYRQAQTNTRQSQAPARRIDVLS